MDSTQNETFSVITFRDVMNIIFRYKFLILTIFITCSILAYFYVRYKPDTYVSEAKLLFKMGRENIEMIPTGENAVSVSRSLDINAEIQILQSPDLYEQLYDDLDIERRIKEQHESENQTPLSPIQLAEAKERTIRNIMNNIQIEVARDANVIIISYGSKEPDFSYNLVSRLIDLYMDKRSEIHYSTASYNFFNEQAKKYLSALNELEKEIAEIKNDLDISSVEEYRTTLMNRIETIRSDLDMNNASIAETESQINMIQSELALSPDTETNRVTVNYESMIEELMDLEIRKRELLSRYTEDNVQVTDINRRINEIRNQLQDLTGNESTSSASLQMPQDLITRKIELAGLKARNAELQNMLAQVRNDLKELNNAELTINQLEREREIQRDNYMRYSNNLEEARIDEIVLQDNMSNVQVLQPPTNPITPIPQRKYRDLAAGMFLGLFGGLGLAFALDYMDHTVKTPEDIENKLNLPTLTSIPYNSHRKDIDSVAHLLLENGKKVG